MTMHHGAHNRVFRAGAGGDNNQLPCLCCSLRCEVAGKGHYVAGWGPERTRWLRCVTLTKLVRHPLTG
jgi:hypothetical protein